MTSLVEAWLGAVGSLLQNDQPLLIFEFDDVTLHPAHLEDISTKLVELGLEKPESVASVLLPKAVLRAQGPLNDRILAGVRTLGRWRRRNARNLSGWSHSYFERLVGRFGKGKGPVVEIGLDQISHIIEKINRWDKDIHAALYAHTNLPNDRLRTRGAPCLQYIQLELHDKDRFTVNALYRSHDYGNKCLGNVIGLCRLGALISSETGRTFDRLRVISLHPHLPNGKKRGLESLYNEFAHIL